MTGCAVRRGLEDRGCGEPWSGRDSRGWWCRREDQVPAPPVERYLVVEGTQQDALLEAGGAAVRPVPDVVDLASGRWLVAAASPSAPPVPREPTSSRDSRPASRTPGETTCAACGRMRVSAETPCECVHKALPRKRRRRGGQEHGVSGVPGRGMSGSAYEATHRVIPNVSWSVGYIGYCISTRSPHDLHMARFPSWVNRISVVCGCFGG